MFRSTHFYPASVLVASHCRCRRTRNSSIVYPSKGQSAEQQQRDQGECMAWAQQTTGVNPTAIAQGLGQSAPTAAARSFEDERLQGAVVGALGGTAIGAIAGSKAGKGAAIGAVVGTVAGGVHQQQKYDEAQAQTYANQQQAQQALASYDRAYGACLEGRGYTVK